MFAENLSAAIKLMAALCVNAPQKVCTQVIISLCQQHESKVCVSEREGGECGSTPTVL